MGRLKVILGDELEMRMDAPCGLCVKHAASWGSAAAKGHVCVAVVGSKRQDSASKREGLTAMLIQ